MPNLTPSANSVRDQMREIQSQIGKSEHLSWYAGQLQCMGPHASPGQRERFELAVAYLEYHHKQSGGPPGIGGAVDREQVRNQLASIDFHQEVELRVLKEGREIRNYQPDPEVTKRGSENLDEIRRSGKFYTQPGVPAERLAISPGSGDYTRQPQAFRVESDMLVLKSHTAPIVDTFSKGRHVREPLTPEQATGAVITNRDVNSGGNRPVKTKQDLGLRPTTKASVAVRTYRSPATGNDRAIDHRSGQYALGGGIQFHLSPRQAGSLTVKPSHRHRPQEPGMARRLDLSAKERRLARRQFRKHNRSR